MPKNEQKTKESVFNGQVLRSHNKAPKTWMYLKGLYAEHMAVKPEMAKTCAAHCCHISVCEFGYKPNEVKCD